MELDYTNSNARLLAALLVGSLPFGAIYSAGRQNIPESAIQGLVAPPRSQVQKHRNYISLGNAFVMRCREYRSCDKKKGAWPEAGLLPTGNDGEHDHCPPEKPRNPSSSSLLTACLSIEAPSSDRCYALRPVKPKMSPRERRPFAAIKADPRDAVLTAIWYALYIQGARQTEVSFSEYRGR